MIRLFAGRDTDSVSLLTRVAALVYDAPLPALCHTAAGKPYFADAPGLHVSLSGSGPYTLCALSDAPVGADIEVVRPRRASLPYRALSARELSAWDGTWPGFYAAWTAKEAAGKYLGTGLRLPLRTFEVPSGVRMRHYFGEDWVASICCDRAPPEAVEWIEAVGVD